MNSTLGMNNLFVVGCIIWYVFTKNAWVEMDTIC